MNKLNHYGRLAQLVEHLLDVQRVRDSSSLPSTILKTALYRQKRLCNAVFVSVGTVGFSVFQRWEAVVAACYIVNPPHCYFCYDRVLTQSFEKSQRFFVFCLNFAVLYVRIFQIKRGKVDCTSPNDKIKNAPGGCRGRERRIPP